MSSDQISQALPAVRAILSALPPGSRADMVRLWSTLRNSLAQQEAEIKDLRNLLNGQVPPRDIPTRPPSSASVHDLRDAINQALSGVGVDSSNAFMQTLTSLPRAWVRAKLDEDRDRSRDNDVGCWFSSRSTSHKQYVKVNLRNSRHPTTREVLGIHPYIHQLALVGDGRGSHLHSTGGATATHQVSHLCHNGACFNPRHLVVEPRELNLARNSCQGKYILVAPDLTTINPCSHWDWRGDGGGGGRQACILPTKKVPKDLSGKWVDTKANQQFILRTGRSTQGA